MSIQSFLANGHEHHLYTYGEIEGVPEGTVVKDGNEILSSDQIFVYKKEKSYAGFSNVFRYKLLYERGHFWVDTDVICLKPFAFFNDLTIGRRPSQYPSPGDEWTCENGVIGAAPGNEFVKQCYDEAISRDPESLNWGETGPDLTTRMVFEMNLMNQTQSEHVFDSLKWWQWYRAIHQKPHYSFIFWNIYKLKGAYSIHLYNEMWRRNEKDKNATYPRHTVYERLKRKYELLKI